MLAPVLGAMEVDRVAGGGDAAHDVVTERFDLAIHRFGDGEGDIRALARREREEEPLGIG